MKISCVMALIGCALASASALGETKAKFDLPSGVKVEIVEDDFDVKKFNVLGCKIKGSACIINNRIPFGAGSDLPKTYVKSISVTFGGLSYSLDASDMYNAWGKRPLEYKGVVRYFGGMCVDGKNCHFRGLFSDGEGSFVAEWIIDGGKPARTMLTYSSDVVDLFMRKIDPPTFNQTTQGGVTKSFRAFIYEESDMSAIMGALRRTTTKKGG